MKIPPALVASITLLFVPVIHAADAPAAQQGVEISGNGARASLNAPASYFTGHARIEPLFQRNDPSHTSAAYVTFEPGARAAWHTHPLGQTLIVTYGSGRVQQWGGPAEVVPPRGVILI